MEPPELFGPGRGGRISGPIQRTYTWRGLASYVEAGTKARRNWDKYRNGAARTGQKQKPARNSGKEVGFVGLMDGNIRRNWTSSSLIGCGENFFNAFVDRNFLRLSVYSDFLQEPVFAIVMEP
jgi:hypothetical protein